MCLHVTFSLGSGISNLQIVQIQTPTIRSTTTTTTQKTTTLPSTTPTTTQKTTTPPTGRPTVWEVYTP